MRVALTGQACHILAIVFGKNLKSLRAKSGLTQAELANASGIHMRYYQDVEAGRKIPSVVIAARMRKTLKCTWEQLMRGVK